MRICINRRQSGGIDASGGTLTGALYTFRDPELPLEAANKRYVDGLFNNLSGNSFLTGRVDPSVLPAMAGDLTSQAGSNNLTLNNSGVSPGWYTKVTVNSKGIVTNGHSVATSDLPNIFGIPSMVRKASQALFQ